MQKTNTGVKTAACLVASVIFGASVSAQTTIYDNTLNYQGRVTARADAQIAATDPLPTAYEIGDTVTFAGSDRILTFFQFEYFVNPSRSGNETVQAFLYANDGPNGLPGTLLFSSPATGVTTDNTGFGSGKVEGIALTVPNTVTWTVRLSGLEGAEDGGLLFANPPTVGSSPTFTDPNTGVATQYTVLHDTAGFHLLDHGGQALADNLSARFTAIPEPGTWAILAGGLALFGVARRRKA